MKKAGIIALFMALIWAFAGCIYIAAGEKIAGNGQTATKEVKLDRAVTGIVNEGDFDVVIDLSIEDKVLLEGESNILEFVSVRQDGDGILTVSFPTNTIILNYRSVTVRIPMLQGGYVQMNGSGTITYRDDVPIDCSSFDIGINGSGDILLNVSSSKVNASVRGSGSIDLSGVTINENIGIEGSGDFNGFGLNAENADIHIRGSGDVNITASKTVTGSIMGSGNITYGGDPIRVDVSGNGSGEAKKR